EEVEKGRQEISCRRESHLAQERREEFRAEVLEKLGRLETKMDMLVGGAQPGRMKIAEDRLQALERSDIRRNVLDRIVSATIAAVVSAVIAMHDHLGLR